MEARFLPAGAERSADLRAALHGSTAVVITTPWPEYAEVAGLVDPGTTIVDLWGQCGGAAADIHLVRPGRAPVEGMSS